MAHRGRWVVSGADLDADAARAFLNPATYTAGVDAIDNGVAGSAYRAHVYGRSELTMDALNEMVSSINGAPIDRNAIVRYDMASTLARYGHLLTPEDQQRLGYVAPAGTERMSPLQLYRPRPLPIESERLQQSLLTPPAVFNEVMAYAFGDRLPADNVLDMINRPLVMGSEVYKWGLQHKTIPDPAIEEARLQKEQAAADEWLKNSPWG